MISVVVMASGRGSHFDALLKATQKGELDAEIKAVVSDRKEALVLQKAQKAGVPAFACPAQGLSREEQESQILSLIEPLQPHFLILAGYMRILSPQFLKKFESGKGYFRVVNIHPSLLPAFPGVGGYAQAYEHGCQLAGATVHLVDQGLDTGPICAQESFLISDCQSAQEVEERGLTVEHRLYTQTLKWVLPERFTLKASHPTKGRYRVCPS